MKNSFLILLSVIILGVFQIPESFSEDYFSTPSCYKGVFAHDYIQCSTRDSPPCPEPSFEKNGYCAVKKIDICESGNVLLDGACIEEDEFYELNSRQSMLTGKPMDDAPNMFGWFVLTLSIFIVFAYVVMKIKKRKSED